MGLMASRGSEVAAVRVGDALSVALLGGCIENTLSSLGRDVSQPQTSSLNCILAFSSSVFSSPMYFAFGTEMALIAELNLCS